MSAIDDEQYVSLIPLMLFLISFWRDPKKHINVWNGFWLNWPGLYVEEGSTEALSAYDSLLSSIPLTTWICQTGSMAGPVGAPVGCLSLLCILPRAETALIAEAALSLPPF